MILAAGRGERLRPLTDHTPKPMVEVRGRPLLAHQIEWLQAAGIRDLVINLHHLGEQIEAHFGDGSAFGVRIQYSREEELLETGGGIVNALPMLGDKPFLILNGDIFTDFPFSTLTPIPDWADIHLVVTPTPDYRDQGDFEYASGRITASGNSYVYCGIAILRPAQFAGEAVAPFSLRDRFFEAIDGGHPVCSGLGRQLDRHRQPGATRCGERTGLRKPAAATGFTATLPSFRVEWRRYELLDCPLHPLRRLLPAGRGDQERARCRRRHHSLRRHGQPLRAEPHHRSRWCWNRCARRGSTPPWMCISW